MNDPEPDETGKPIDINTIFERIDELAAEGLTISEARAWEELTDDPK
jgi:hypothetical protein